MRSPTTRRKEWPAKTQAGALLAGKQLCWKGTGFEGKQQAECETVVAWQQKTSTGCWAVWRVSQGMWPSHNTYHSLDHIYNTMWGFGSPNTGKTSTIWSRFSRGHPDAQGVEHLACAKELGDLTLVSLEMGRWTQQNICQPYNGAGTFTKGHSGKMIDNRHTLEQEKLYPNMRTNCPHSNRQAVEEVTPQGCAISLLSWRFSKPERITPWAIWQTALSNRLG